MLSSPVVLVDAYAQIYRCYYAVKTLNTKSGQPVNAIMGIVKFLLRLNSDYSGTAGVWVFDKGRPAARMALAPDYKANRPPMPLDLRQQQEYIRKFIRAFGWNIVERQNYEADDLIAGIAKKFSGEKVQIFSGDKDIAQIIDGRVVMIMPDYSLRDVAAVKEKFGVAPEQIPDYLALIGDSADNIPGVDGVGPKTAAKLLNSYGSGKNIFEHVDQVHGEALKANLAASKDLFDKNLKLVLLDDELPDDMDLTLENGLKRSEPDWDAVRRFCLELEMKSVLKDIPAGEGPVCEKSEQLTLF